jgi:hypothetical protein
MVPDKVGFSLWLTKSAMRASSSSGRAGCIRAHRSFAAPGRDSGGSRVCGAGPNFRIEREVRRYPVSAERHTRLGLRSAKLRIKSAPNTPAR